jgi:hypothetical protein
MYELDSNSKIYYYIIYFLLFFIGQAFAIWGSYSILKFPNLTFWESYKKAIPFAWIYWMFLTPAIYIGHKYNLVSPSQNIFLLIILQFTLVILINKYYLKIKVYRSDFISFGLILFGYFISIFHIVSQIFNIPIPLKPISEAEKEKEKEKKKEASSVAKQIKENQDKTLQQNIEEE